MTCKHEWIKHPNNELLEMCPQARAPDYDGRAWPPLPAVQREQPGGSAPGRGRGAEVGPTWGHSMGWNGELPE